MKKRQIRQDGKMVSEVGLGCWSFGGSYGPTTEAEAHNTLSAALDHGVDFLDTANVYGMGVSESIIGSFLKGDQTVSRLPPRERSGGTPKPANAALTTGPITCAANWRPLCQGWGWSMWTFIISTGATKAWRSKT